MSGQRSVTGQIINGDNQQTAGRSARSIRRVPPIHASPLILSSMERRDRHWVI
jgi:hypothetical protein